VRIRVLSIFEGVVYHSWPVDRSDPERPTLEVEALLRPGDADAESGPLLFSVADYVAMVGDLTIARRALDRLAGEGRIDQHLGVDHIVFPTWTRVGPEAERSEQVDHTGADGSDAEPSARPALRVVRSDEAIE
jgi:hypothetical protein